jgi:hypothetical protein
MSSPLLWTPHVSAIWRRQRSSSIGLRQRGVTVLSFAMRATVAQEKSVLAIFQKGWRARRRASTLSVCSVVTRVRGRRLVRSWRPAAQRDEIRCRRYVDNALELLRP